MKRQWRDSLPMGKMQNKTTRKYQHEVIELSDRDRVAFVTALVNPSAPNKRLVKRPKRTWRS